MAKNKRLNALSAELQARPESQHQQTGQKVRLFAEFQCKAHSWDRRRRILVMAGHNAQGANPRYLVTNLAGDPQKLYDEVYCLGVTRDPDTPMALR